MGTTQPISIIAYLFSFCVAFWAQNLSNYIQAKPFWETRVRLETLPPDVKFPISLKDKISYDANTKFLIFRGNMSEVEKDQLFKLSQDGLFGNAVKELFRASETSAKLAELPPDVKFPDSLKDKIRYDARKRLLTFRGMMSPGEKTDLQKLSDDLSFRKAVDTLFQASETSERLEKLPPDVEFPQPLKEKMMYEAKRKLLIFRGVMSGRERDELVKLLENKVYRDAIEKLFQKSLSKPPERREGWYKPAFITLVSGGLFLADILCVLWWYARYIYRIQPTPTFMTHFLDFLIVATFVFAATRWDDATMFSIATLFGSLILLTRFIFLYLLPDATGNDRLILRRAGYGLFLAFWVSGGAILGIMGFVALLAPGGTEEFNTFILPAIPGVLSFIGLVLTFWLRKKIETALVIHERSYQRFIPMNLLWPAVVRNKEDMKTRLMQNTALGLKAFHKLFELDAGKRSVERVRSRVHPEADLRIQSYILSITSPEQGHAGEVKNKAFMVALSHWLDDLLDGRNEVIVYRKLKRCGADYGLRVKDSKIDDPQSVFEQIYRDLIKQHTYPKFYDNLFNEINQATMAENREYLFWSLNRVALGAVIFGPRVHQRDRKAVLEVHNKIIRTLVATNKKWSTEINTILDKMQRIEEGQILLGLTTKTVLEMAMACEERTLDFNRSLLYSLLYAPLLYFHDIDGELECREMVPLDTFDVNYEEIIPWLKDIRKLCEADSDDERRDYRSQQLEMSFRCFAQKLPQSVRSTLKEIYMPGSRLRAIGGGPKS